MPNFIEAVVDKLGPWIICAAIVGILLYEHHRHEAVLVSMNRTLTSALELIAHTQQTQTDLLARDGFLLPPTVGPLR
jgi:hypothetical protein